MTAGSRAIAVMLAAATLAGCQPRESAEEGKPFEPEYLSVETFLLDDDLVNFRLAMKGARTNDDLAAYADCAVAQYALIRDYGFARHVRTNVAKEGGIWRADAIYTISPTLPDGIRTIDAETIVQDCEARGIPTV